MGKSKKKSSLEGILGLEGREKENKKFLGCGIFNTDESGALSHVEPEKHLNIWARALQGLTLDLGGAVIATF